MRLSLVEFVDRAYIIYVIDTCYAALRLLKLVFRGEGFSIHGFGIEKFGLIKNWGPLHLENLFVLDGYLQVDQSVRLLNLLMNIAEGCWGGRSEVVIVVFKDNIFWQVEVILRISIRGYWRWIVAKKIILIHEWWKNISTITIIIVLIFKEN